MTVGAIRAIERAQIQLADRIEDCPGEVALGQPLQQRRRQQERLITISLDEVLGHGGHPLKPAGRRLFLTATKGRSGTLGRPPWRPYSSRGGQSMPHRQTRVKEKPLRPRQIRLVVEALWKPQPSPAHPQRSPESAGPAHKCSIHRDLTRRDRHLPTPRNEGVRVRVPASAWLERPAMWRYWRSRVPGGGRIESRLWKRCGSLLEARA